MSPSISTISADTVWGLNVVAFVRLDCGMAAANDNVDGSSAWLDSQLTAWG